MSEERELAERKLMAIQETINEQYDDEHFLSAFLGYSSRPGIFYSLLNLQDSVIIHAAEISIDLVIERLIEANDRMIESIKNKNVKLHTLQRALGKESE